MVDIKKNTDMGYKRFLNDEDYMALITEEALGQIIRERHNRLEQAESYAETTMLEYLSQYYEVEKELAIGKRIAEYTPMISYPPGVWFIKDNVIYKTLTAINGYQKPSSKAYWRPSTLYMTSEQMEGVRRYSQLNTYTKGDFVRYGSEIYECLENNGFDFLNIRIPDYEVWKEIENIPEWSKGIEYSLNDIVSFNGNYYILLDIEGYDPLELPDSSNPYWGKIGDYTPNYNFSYDPKDCDYVVFEGKVFIPTRNPNADKLEENVNIVRNDPRNESLVQHMTKIALYNLHALISPTNISETRRVQYEDSMAWLVAASRIKIMISIPRKRNEKNGDEVAPFAIETFARAYDPWQNDWIV